MLALRLAGHGYQAVGRARARPGPGLSLSGEQPRTEMSADHDASEPRALARAASRSGPRAALNLPTVTVRDASQHHVRVLTRTGIVLSSILTGIVLVSDSDSGSDVGSHSDGAARGPAPAAAAARSQADLVPRTLSGRG